MAVTQGNREAKAFPELNPANKGLLGTFFFNNVMNVPA